VIRLLKILTTLGIGYLFTPHNASVSNQGSPPIIFLYSSSVKALQVSLVKLP
jgi:hypothetical protein